MNGSSACIWDVFCVNFTQWNELMNLSLMGCLHVPANVQQTSSNRNAGRLRIV